MPGDDPGYHLILNGPFIDLVTQKANERERPSPFPEVQIGRFMMKVKAGYPLAEEEKEIVKRVRGRFFRGNPRRWKGLPHGSATSFVWSPDMNLPNPACCRKMLLWEEYMV